MDDHLHTATEAAVPDLSRPLAIGVLVLVSCAVVGLLVGLLFGLAHGTVGADVVTGLTFGTAVGGLLGIVPVLRTLRTLP